MGTYRRTAAICIAIVIAPAGFHAGADSPGRCDVREISAELVEGGHLPFFVEGGGMVLADPMVGIRILEMRADDVLVEPIESLIVFDSINRATVDALESGHIYMVSTDSLLFFSVDLESNALLEYHVPEGTERLEVQYKRALPQGGLSSQSYLLRAQRSF